jgi:ribonucleoside-triphosphate reductase
VYSRITGYYRPVQNWNDGKAQEFKDRKVYNIAHSKLTHKGALPDMDAGMEAALEPPCCAPEEPAMLQDEEALTELQSDELNNVLLFKTPTCPNCKAAMALLDRAGIHYTALNANEEKELVERYGVRQAPTLVLVGKDGFEKFRGVSDIKGWLMHHV